MQSLLVKDYMSEVYHVITADMNLSKAVDILLSNNLTGTPVTDSDRNILGFISEKDCISHIVTSSYYCDEPPNVAEIMSKKVASVTPDTSILKVAELMSSSVHKVYPVLQGTKVVGIIRRRDILKILLDSQVDCFGNKG
jgi:CBS domain-containing protein